MIAERFSAGFDSQPAIYNSAESKMRKGMIMNKVAHYDHHSLYKIETLQDTYYCNHWEYVVCEDYYSQRLNNGYMCTPHLVFQDRSGYWYVIECSEVNVILEWVDGAYR